MENRRQHVRHAASVPVSISTGDRKDRLGITRDLSAGGILFQSASRFAPGEEVEIRIAVSRTTTSTAIGRVVRSYRADEPDCIFRNLTAVVFQQLFSEVDLLAG